MTKGFLASLSCVLVASALTMGAEASPDTARKKSAVSRTIEIRYDDGAIPSLICLHCPQVRALRGERFVSVEVIDDLSPRGNMDVAWTPNEPDDPGYFNVCGKTDTTEKIRPSADLTFYPWMIPGENCTGFSTSGTIKITFTRRP